MKSTTRKVWSVLSVVMFTILATFFGVGLTWLTVSLVATGIFKMSFDQIATRSGPILIAGGVLGCIGGLVSSLWVAKTDPQTERKIQEKYVGAGGRAQIYSGAPMFVCIVLWAILFGPLIRIVGATYAAYICVAVFTVCVLSGLYLYERIPKRFIVPIGITGWILVIVMALAFYIYTVRQPM